MNCSKVPKGLDLGCLREMALAADEVVGSAHGGGACRAVTLAGSTSAAEGD